MVVALGWADAVPDAQRFDRVIELVTQDDTDRRQARQRWRQYQQAGLMPESLDVANLS
ncbi:MAG: hypothetical protein Fur007_23020 [Rhodoferax sp.]